MQNAPAASTEAVLSARKLELEIEKLTLDVATLRRVRRFELILRLMPSLTIMVTVLGFAFSIWQYSSEQRLAREAAERQAIREAEASQREFMKPLLDQQQSLYFQASTAAATIASSTDPVQRRLAVDKFWMLFWGPLVMVENTDVSGAMKSFSRCLDGQDKCNAGEIQNRSLTLASTLESSILKTWNTKPDDFIKGQFVYR